MKWTDIHTAITTIILISGIGYWAANNVVFAGDYQRYQTQQQIRWLMYDERQLYIEHRATARIHDKTLVDRMRLKDLEHDMKLKRDEINSMR